MCELHGFTEARTGFARLVHAEAHAVAALRSLWQFAQRCSTAAEVAEEIRFRMVGKVRDLGLSPDVLGDAAEQDEADRARPLSLRVGDHVQDAAGNTGLVTSVMATSNGPHALVAFDLPGGPRTLVRPCALLELVRARGAA